MHYLVLPITQESNLLRQVISAYLIQSHLDTKQDRYHVFMRIVREWRHIRLMKRMGRGHSPTGVYGTKEGECAVLCPACPYPGINMPSNWRTAPESQQ